MPKISFFYFRHPDGIRLPVGSGRRERRVKIDATVAYCYEPFTGQVFWAASFRHPRLESRFVKANGRYIAVCRLEKRCVTVQLAPNSSQRAVREAIEKELWNYRKRLNLAAKILAREPLSIGSGVDVFDLRV